MAEYIVECSEVPHPTKPGSSLVLPVSTGGSVHERVTRCHDCDFRSQTEPVYCRAWHKWIYVNGYCHRAKPKVRP